MRPRPAAGILLLLPAILVAAAPPGRAAENGAAQNAAADLRSLIGQTLFVLNPTTVRTRGGGNLSVDLPRGQPVVLVDLAGDRALLSLTPADAELLRSFGVRKTPRYTITPRQLAADFLPAPAWTSALRDGVRRLQDRWPELDAERAEKIFLGQPFLGMTEEQAEEAVGRLVLARSAVPAEEGAVAWSVGRRPRAAELRLFTEARERGTRARTFEEFLAHKTRAVLIFRGGILAAIDLPPGQATAIHRP